MVCEKKGLRAFAKCVDLCQPARTAQADMGRYFLRFLTFLHAKGQFNLMSLSGVSCIDCMAFNVFFSGISVILVLRRPVHLSMLLESSFVLCTIFFPSHWQLSHMTMVEIMVSDERGMNPVAIVITNPRKEY